MKKILLTGGAGYIGSVLTPLLLQKGFEVTVIDNFMYKQPSLASVTFHRNLNIVYGDVRDYSIMKTLISKADVVIPLAAIVGAPACHKDPKGSSSINKDSIIWLLNSLSSNQQIIMPTTNSAYGSGNEDNYCDENSKLTPLSLYAKDKVIVESELLQKSNATSFRLATVFGISPRMRLDLLVNNFVYRALTDKHLALSEGHFKRNYVHLRDVCQVFLYAIENPEKVEGQVFNFGLSSANISKEELCQEIKLQLPDFTYTNVPFQKDPDQRNYIVSNKKIENLGAGASISLSEGIKELIKGLGMFISSPYTNL